jgi:putative transcriptional regulator
MRSKQQRRGFSDAQGLSPIRNSIRRLRFDADEMTQADLARRAGLARQTIVALEQGRQYPSLEAAFRIAGVFGLDIEDVFQWSTPREAGTDPASPAD